MVSLITNIEIQNFKGIKQCNIEGIRRINFFIGKNDACKSTILESIYHTLMESIEGHLGRVLGRRSNVFFGAKELWYNYQIRNPIRIETEFQKAKLIMEIQANMTISGYYSVQSVIDAEDLNVKKTNAGTTTQYSSDLTLGSRGTSGKGYAENLSKKSRDVIGKYIQQLTLLDNSVKNDIQSIEKLLGRLKSSGLDVEFGKYLDSIFEKGENWEFMPHPENYQEYRVAFKNGVPRFLTGMGDGIKYAMRIIGTALMVNNTGIFIEEIESNQHPASLRKLISFLIETAFRNNLQLFITTHNPSVLQNVIYHFRPEEGKLDKRANDVNVFHVQREDLTGKVTCEPIDTYYSKDYNRLMGDIS